ncbi:MAG: xylulokinase [Subdoligranulum sp.]|nr:xylulokinase [Subdoligranulum sp.]
MERYILAHDLGTSGNKATLYRADGTLAASAVASYETRYPHPGWAEQDPEDWWRAICESSKDLMARAGAAPGEVACISFSAQMMGCLLVDKDGTPLRPMIIWADTRAAAQEKRMLDTAGMETVYRVTGHRASASYSAAKLLWVRDNEPEVYAKACKMLHAKDFIIHRLTGRFVTDYSDASGTNLFDIRKKEWSKEICAALDIPLALLPEPHPSADVAGTVTERAARACGLLAGTPVVIGGGDGSCACVGAGVVAEGNTYCVLGSSSWISTASREPVYDDKMRTFNWVHLDPAFYTPCGTMQAAGVSYSWYRDTLCAEERLAAKAAGKSAYALIDEAARSTRPGANGLLYLPYLLGERSPRWNHAARGAFVGLDITTTRAEMSRAVMEGVGYNLKVILDILEGRQPIEALTLIGGGAKGRLWLEILADIWQKPLEVPAYLEEATSLGAAVCGGVGVGLFPDYSAVRQFNKTVERIEPNRANAGRYQTLYAAFNEAYEALVPVYGKLAAYRAQTEEKPC